MPKTMRTTPLLDRRQYALHDVRGECQVSRKQQSDDSFAFIVNGYYHLSHPNDQPSYGGQWMYKATPRLTLTQTLFTEGRIKTNTALEFWRFYANHIVEWKGDDITIAASYVSGLRILRIVREVRGPL